MKKINYSYRKHYLILIIFFLNHIVIYSNDLKNKNSLESKQIKNSEQLQNFKDTVWSTYFGGTGNDIISNIAVDSYNNIIIAGSVDSKDMPINSNSYQQQNNGNYDFFIAKFSHDYKLLWSTYLGGNAADYLVALGVDTNNNIWISGEVNSQDFPTTYNAVKQTHSGGSRDIIICKLDRDGQLDYSTYLGGSNYESAPLIAFDHKWNVYFAGRSWSKDFPTTNDAYQKNKLGYYDGILIKFNVDTYEYYATYIGIPNNGGEDNLYIEGLTIDNQNNIIFGGHTNSSIVPMINSKLSNKFKGIYDVYLMKFDKSMNQIWSNYYGGSGNDRLSNITCDENDNLYCIGFTTSNDLIMKNSYQSTKSNGEDAYIFKINKDGELKWSTYLGGMGIEGNPMTDANIDRIYGDIKYYDNKIGILFKTTSFDLPIIGSEYYSNSYLGGSYDAFSMILDSDGKPIQSTYIGGNHIDVAYSSVFNKDYIFICGYTLSDNIKITSNAYQKTYKSAYDGFVIKFMKKVPEPQDTLPPVIQGEYELCGLFKEIRITDDRIHDKGIKTVDIISNNNCNIQTFFVDIRKILIRIKLVDTTNNGDYEINVIDSAGHVLNIKGNLIPDISTKISLSPSDTLFIISNKDGSKNCDSLTIINKNKDEYILWDGIFVYNNVEFTISLNQLPLKIPANDSAKLEICFSPKNGTDSIYYDSLFVGGICSPKKLILVSKKVLEPEDNNNPVPNYLYDSCSDGREWIVTDEKVNDRGIKTVERITEDNCKIQIIYETVKKVRVIIESIDKTQLSNYRFHVYDSVGHLVMVWGGIAPYRIYNLFFRPSDTLFFKPALFGSVNCDSITLINNNSNEYIFDNAFVFNNNGFTIPANQLPLKIPAKDSIKLKVCFSPQKWSSATSIDSVFCSNSCFSKKFILVSKVISDDKTPPKIQSETDSCGLSKEIIITEDKINDTGIKSADVIINDNCKIVITKENSKKFRIRISLDNITKKGTYQIKVIDSVDNEFLVEGFLLPSSSNGILFNPSDTLFIKPTFAGNISCDTLTIVNQNEFEYILNDLYFYRNIEFSTPLHQFPLKIPAKDSIKINICFSPKKWESAKYFDSLYFSDACFAKKLILASETFYLDYNGDSRCNISLSMNFDSTTNKSVHIFPNPAQNSLQISIIHQPEIPAKIMIFNSVGEIVIENIINSPSQIIDELIDVSNLNSGVYFVVTNNGQEINYKKVIISR
jgi:hypothetical protein